MGTGNSPLVGQVCPKQAWEILGSDKDARLIDVRTQAEWAFVGVPDLTDSAHDTLFIEWARYPEMSPNPTFVADVKEALGGDNPGTLLFICRSGVRSLHAAMAVATSFARNGSEITCLNVMEGFEGDLDASGHRGDHNGWKARGLAWRQS
ncbi:MAG: rhodanese-like domain-containing protein [Pseudomonadota bacterium]